MRFRGFVALVGTLFTIGLSNAAAPLYKYSPAGTLPGAYYSIPLGVSLTQIVGYSAVPNKDIGYIQTGKSFVLVDPGDSIGSHVSGINRYGAAVGGYCPTGCNIQAGVHGFLYQSGKLTNIDYPLPNTTTTANGINDLGQIVGGYCPNSTVCPAGAFSPAFFGFLDDNGVFTSLLYPGALDTQANAINNTGQIVGIYDINDTGPHSYLYADGLYTNIDYPGSNYTVASAINNAGVVAGLYADQITIHGFTYSNGIFTSIDAPGGYATTVTGINDRGDIVGLRNTTAGQSNFKGIPQATAPEQ